MPDFYTFVAGAVSKLDPNTALARADFYEKSRDALLTQLNRSAYPQSQISEHLKLLDDAIDRIESEYAVDAESKAPLPPNGTNGASGDRAGRIAIDDAAADKLPTELNGSPSPAPSVDAPDVNGTAFPPRPEAAHAEHSVEGAAPAIPTIEGVVARYLPLSWSGFIAVPGETSDYYFERKSVKDELHLMVNERVRFVPGIGQRGPRATAVELIGDTPWLRGVVKQWDLEKGYGLIESRNTEYFAYYSNVRMAGERYLEKDEPVVFRVLEPKKPGDRSAKATDIMVFQPRHPAMRFANLRSLKRLLPTLADMAVKEPWEYSPLRRQEVPDSNATEATGDGRDERPHNLKVLEDYVVYTLNRLVEEEKIVVSGRSAYANIGLQTKEFHADIIALFGRHSGPTPQEWELREFVTASSVQVAELPVSPQLAQYITEPAHLIYNNAAKLTLNIEHIIRDNRSRLEKLGISAARAQSEINDAKAVALDRVRRNYKIAIPSWRRGQIQLLLPLCLKSDYSNPELALVVNRAADNYFAPTALTIAQAYTNARLIARPDPEWLRP